MHRSNTAMNTAAKSSATTKLLVNESTNNFETFGIESSPSPSPVEETAASTPTTVESTTAQISSSFSSSSKSSSPFNALNYKESESTRLSPLSSQSESHNQTLKSPKSLLENQESSVTGSAAVTNSNSNIPAKLSKESFCKQKRKKKTDISGSLLKSKNMIASTSGSCSSSNSSSQQSNVAGATSIPATSVSSPTNSIKNIKCEPYTALSPCNENSQNMLEENSNNNSNSNNNALESNIRERDGTTSSSMLRQNSNSSVNSCSATVNASSPNNGSDHSNSSNISSNISQNVDGNTDILPDRNVEKTTKKKNSTNNFNVKDDDNNGNTSDKPNTQMKITTSNMSSLNTAVKEEPGVLNNLASVKEENVDSPNMSPVGFGSIEGTVRAITPVKVNEVTSNNTSSGNNEKMVSNLIPSSGGCSSEDTSGLNSNAPSEACNSVGGGPVGPGLQHAPSNHFNNTSGGGNSTAGSLVGNCMDYMQQQNHIFVFSTQLANKGAEAVLSGQFPTIIAYHCTQPATKSFLEDFFIKNPMKMTKLQRQNSLNLCSISVGGGGNSGAQHWMGGGGCNNIIPKMQQQQQQQQQKSNCGKINFGGLNPNVEHKPAPIASALLRQTNMATGGGFTETDSIVGNENDLMCWESTTRQNLEAAAADPTHGLKMLDGSVVECSSKSIGAVDGCVNDGNIPSLQGVKVPDENLTPQQRQHREEQLAKLKKMNQFLFPENGNEFRPDVATAGKLNVDGGGGGVPVSGNLAGIMLNLPGTAGQGMNTSQIGNSHNPALRGGNISTNVLNHHQNKTSEHMTASLGSDDASEIMGTHDMGGKATCGNSLSSVSSQPNIACGPTVGNMPGNSLGGIINGPGPGGHISVMPNSPPEVVMGGVFNQNDGNLGGSGTAGPTSKNMISIGGMHLQDMNRHVGMAQMEWSKLQHQFFEERLKCNKSANDIALATMCRSNSTGIGGGVGVNVRSNMVASACGSSAGGVGINAGAGNGGAGSGGSGIQILRSAQGPPPPYHHPTQRSASVPIATQSPNPTSPNNPTSNLSLPSPRTAGTLSSVPGNSPNMDMQHAVPIQSQSSSAPPPPTATTSSVITTTASVNPTNSTLNTNNTQAQKNSSSFQQDGSPQSAGGCGSSGNNNRNRCGNLSSYNSNPSTPLSHMSPKDMEAFNTGSGATTADLKNARPSPQRSRTPLLPANSNNLVEPSNIEVRFPPGGLGLNFATHMQNPANIAANNYKAPCPIERQNSAPLPTQFCRRTDNLPLNPNSNRAPQNKLNHTFDPISSLAQMSQQLTSCVSLNNGGGGGVGNSPGGGGGGMGHLVVPNDMGQMSANVVNQQNMESIMSLDGGGGGPVGVGGIMDHCGTAVALNHMGGIGGVGMPPHMSAGVGPFMSANCHINPMLGTIGGGGQQRMLNPKLCGGSGFNPGGMREGPANFHGVMPPAHRMINRMAVNFGNFNLSPNIQVKASTPNTIQYMPVRAQNNSNNPTNNPNNIRAQPSLEFLHRYANPQMVMENNGGGGGPHMGQLNPDNHPGGDPNKLNQNPNNMPPGGMNFFQNCNQMTAMEDDGSMLPSAHDINMGGGGIGGHASLIRGMRPNMRQQHMSHSPSRLQAPGGVSSVMPQFPIVNGQTQEVMECSDAAAAAMFGASSGPGPGQIYSGPGPSAGHQKNTKSGMNGGICQNMNPAAGGGNNGQQVSNVGGLIQNEQHNSVAMQQQSPVNVAGLGLGPGSGGNVMQNHALALGGGGNNASSPGGAIGGNVVNYKSFVGPASNDLKYAQQYHSFQQQLYATSTRSHQGQGGGGNSNLGPNLNSNPVAFFVNK